MAKLIYIDFDNTTKEAEIKEMNKEDLIEKAENLDIPFGCTDGRCASCRVEVLEGKENLTPLNYKEKDLGFTENEPYRLLCQCKLTGGLIKIRT